MLKNVKGFEGYYVVDDTGQVFSIHSNRYLTPILMRNGYLYVHLQKDSNVERIMRLHRVVAEAFLPKRKDQTQVNHKNGIKTDNRVDNLEWCTQEENIQHAMRNGLFNPVGENNPSAKLSEGDVITIRRVFQNGNKRYGAKALAREYGVTDTLIRKIVNGEIWKNIAIATNY